MIELQEEILKWTRFAGARELRSVLTDLLDTPQKLLIYHLSNGKRGREGIAKDVNVAGTTVRDYWISWFRWGIMEAIRVRGGTRYKKSFKLGEFGFKIPKIKKVEKNLQQGEN